jgi:hypothetical protein
MVQLIPAPANAHANANADPTMSEIDTYIRETRAAPASEGGVAALMRTVREIQSKSGAGASLHPVEEYFMERVGDHTM